MISWSDVIAKQREYQDLVREAEDRGLVEQALVVRKRRAPFVRRVLVALARPLVNLGCYFFELGASALKVSVQKPCADANMEENL